MTKEPLIDRRTRRAEENDMRLTPVPATARCPVVNLLIILGYLVVFWALLPAVLFVAGFHLDRRLPVSLGGGAPGAILGWCLALSGILLMACSMMQLWLHGKGLPISHLPPTEFVTTGAYQYLRHPIYVGYTLAFAGAAVLLHSFWSLALSTPLLLIGWISYAVFYEERVLSRRFGERYVCYVRSTALLLPKEPIRMLASNSWSARQWRGTTDSERLFFIKRGLFLYLLWIICFEGLGRYAATLPTHDLTLSLDDRIPFIPVFIWPYVFCYFFALLPGFVATDWHRVCRGILSILIANLTSFVVYLAYPVAFPKPEPGSTPAERLIRLEYIVDFHPGANNLPSLHVIFAWLIYFICLRQGLRKTGEHLILLMAVLITVSTLFVKQHILADVAAGIVWAVVSWRAAGFFYRRWRLRTGDAKEAFRTMLRRLAPFFAATMILMALFAIPR